MANIVNIQVGMRLVPDAATVELALKILDVWQEGNETQRVMFDDADRRYKIFETGWRE